MKFSYNKIYTGLSSNRIEIPIQLYAHVRALLRSLCLFCTVCVFVCPIHTHTHTPILNRDRYNGAPCADIHVTCICSNSLSGFLVVHGLRCALSHSLAIALAPFFYGSCVVCTYTERHGHTARLAHPNTCIDRSHMGSLSVSISVCRMLRWLFRSLRILILVCTNFDCFGTEIV